MGERMGQRGRGDRLEEAAAAEKLQGLLAEEVVVERTFSWLSDPKNEQRL